jgi:hypothetical protein
MRIDECADTTNALGLQPHRVSMLESLVDDRAHRARHARHQRLCFRTFVGVR